jgi:hypothetical protein
MTVDGWPFDRIVAVWSLVDLQIFKFSHFSPKFAVPNGGCSSAG